MYINQKGRGRKRGWIPIEGGVLSWLGSTALAEGGSGWGGGGMVQPPVRGREGEQRQKSREEFPVINGLKGRRKRNLQILLK